MNREEVEKILTHGEWFILITHDGNKYLNKYLIQFEKIQGDIIFTSKWFSFVFFHQGGYSENGLCNIRYIKEIRPAAKEEVIRYFPNEVFHEPKKRPITRNKKQYILR